MKRPWIAIVLLLSAVVAGQERAASPLAGGTPLAKVSMTVEHAIVRRGTNLRVQIKLTAGPQGAWLPKYFGDWDDNCQSGFAVYLATPDGRRASGGRGCGGSWLGPCPPAEQLLQSQYVFLKPGEERTWPTILTGITKVPGMYEVRGEYLSAQHCFYSVAELPEVRDLLVIGHLRAIPVPVKIR